LSELRAWVLRNGGKIEQWNVGKPERFKVVLGCSEMVPQWFKVVPQWFRNGSGINVRIQPGGLTSE
jgi:hypothetical protein